MNQDGVALSFDSKQSIKKSDSGQKEKMWRHNSNLKQNDKAETSQQVRFVYFSNGMGFCKTKQIHRCMNYKQLFLSNEYHFSWRVRWKWSPAKVKESLEQVVELAARLERNPIRQAVLACPFQMLETGSRWGSPRGRPNRGWSFLRCLASSNPKACWSSLDRSPPRPGCPRWSPWLPLLSSSPFSSVCIRGNED